MNKKEILQRGRNENITEYEEKIINDSHRFGNFVIIGICVLFFAINVTYSEINSLAKGIASFDYAAILMSYVSYQYLYKFTKTKEHNNLIAGIALGLVCGVFIYLYIINL